MSSETKYWHVYGGEMDAGVWASVTAGGSEKAPDDPAVTEGLNLTSVTTDAPWHAAHLASFDHEPDDDEMDALVPERFQDG